MEFYSFARFDVRLDINFVHQENRGSIRIIRLVRRIDNRNIKSFEIFSGIVPAMVCKIACKTRYYISYSQSFYTLSATICRN